MQRRPSASQRARCRATVRPGVVRRTDCCNSVVLCARTAQGDLKEVSESMSEKAGAYDFGPIERKWQEYWEPHKTFQASDCDASRPKYYVLDLFPYPSGQGLLVGHPEGYHARDIVSRSKRM